MTSGPTAAMLAAVRGEPYEIAFTGSAQYDFAPDVARAFVTAASTPLDGARVFNVPGALASVDDVIDAIRAVVPDAEVTAVGGSLPFPAELESVGFEREIGPFPRTSLSDGRRGDDRALPPPGLRARARRAVRDRGVVRAVRVHARS